MTSSDTNTVNDVTGEVGEVYAAPRSSLLIDHVAESDLVDNGIKENTEGWMQINPSQRARVIRRRISHSMCIWKVVEDTIVTFDDFPAGLAH